MRKRGKILKLFKKKFKFKKYKKIILLKKKNKALYFKNKKSFFFINNIVSNKFNLYNNINYYDVKNFFFYDIQQLEIVNDFFYKIKNNANRLLLNVYLKDKLVKNNKFFKKTNVTAFFKFTIFFLKKIIAQKLNNTAFILIKIKKNQLKKRLKKKKIIRKKFLLVKWEPFIKKKIMYKLAKIILIFKLFLANNHLKIIPLYNKSHSKNTTKLKKKRRK